MISSSRDRIQTQSILAFSSVLLPGFELVSELLMFSAKRRAGGAQADHQKPQPCGAGNLVQPVPRTIKLVRVEHIGCRDEFALAVVCPCVIGTHDATIMQLAMGPVNQPSAPMAADVVETSNPVSCLHHHQVAPLNGGLKEVAGALQLSHACHRQPPWPRMPASP